CSAIPGIHNPGAREYCCPDGERQPPNIHFRSIDSLGNALGGQQLWFHAVDHVQCTAEAQQEDEAKHHAVDDGPCFSKIHIHNIFSLLECCEDDNVRYSPNFTAFKLTGLVSKYT